MHRVSSVGSVNGLKSDRRSDRLPLLVAEASQAGFPGMLSSAGCNGEQSQEFCKLRSSRSLGKAELSVYTITTRALRELQAYG